MLNQVLKRRNLLFATYAALSFQQQNNKLSLIKFLIVQFASYQTTQLSSTQSTTQSQQILLIVDHCYLLGILFKAKLTKCVYYKIIYSLKILLHCSPNTVPVVVVVNYRTVSQELVASLKEVLSSKHCSKLWWNRCQFILQLASLLRTMLYILVSYRMLTLRNCLIFFRVS